MFDLDHKVRVFVFQVLPEDVQFLLLQRKPVSEWPLGPIVGSVRPEEHLQDTIHRKVREETGIERSTQVLDLQPQKELFGDMGLVEWTYAFQAGTPDQPVLDLQPGPAVGDMTWLSFNRAFEQIGSDLDRQSLVRLQMILQ